MWMEVRPRATPVRPPMPPVARMPTPREEAAPRRARPRRPATTIDTATTRATAVAREGRRVDVASVRADVRRAPTRYVDVTIRRTSTRVGPTLQVSTSPTEAGADRRRPATERRVRVANTATIPTTTAVPDNRARVGCDRHSVRGGARPCVVATAAPTRTDVSPARRASTSNTPAPVAPPESSRSRRVPSRRAPSSSAWN